MLPTQAFSYHLDALNPIFGANSLLGGGFQTKAQEQTMIQTPDVIFQVPASDLATDADSIDDVLRLQPWLNDRSIDE